MEDVYFFRACRRLLTSRASARKQTGWERRNGKRRRRRRRRNGGRNVGRNKEWSRRTGEKRGGMREFEEI